MTGLVVVDATPYGPLPSGARRRAVEILRRLPALLPADVIEVHWAADGGGPPPDLLGDNLVHAVVGVSCRGGALRWWRRRRDLVRRHRAAPFTHLLTDHGPVVVPGRVANFVTLHDLRFLHGYGGPVRALYARMRYGSVLRRAHRVVAVSPSVAAEATSYFRLDPARVVVAPNAPSAVFRPVPGAAREGVLVAARDEPRKARGAAVAAARDAGVSLRVADPRAEVSDEGLRALYAGARWLLAPSLDEGFDLPVAEALACGTPVIASDIPAHRDVVAYGARGVVLVPPPRREGGAWSWPEAARALAVAPPADVAPPSVSWDETARLVATALRT